FGSSFDCCYWFSVRTPSHWRDGRSNVCAVVPGEQNNGWRGFVASDQRSFPIGGSSMSAAEHRKPCELRGSRTVLGARGGESPPRDSPTGGHHPTIVPHPFGWVRLGNSRASA